MSGPARMLEVLESLGTPAQVPVYQLDALPWRHTSPVYRALDWTFQVRTTHASLGHFVDHILAALRCPERRADHCYSLVVGEPDNRRPGVLYVDGDRIRWTTDPAVLFGRLLWHVNQSAIAHTRSRYTLLHSAVVERDGVAALLVAPMESGKTTLTAALVRRGLGYLSDELAAIDPDTGDVLAYPKPLSIDEGSWGVLAELEPDVAPEVRPFVARQWQLSADDVSPGATRSRARPGVIVLPRYSAGARTTLTPVPRAALLAEVAQQSFGVAVDPTVTMRTLSSTVRASRGYRLVFDDLDAAADLVLGVMARAAAASLSSR